MERRPRQRALSGTGRPNWYCEDSGRSLAFHKVYIREYGETENGVRLEAPGEGGQLPAATHSSRFHNTLAIRVRFEETQEPGDLFLAASRRQRLSYEQKHLPDSRLSSESKLKLVGLAGLEPAISGLCPAL